ncbi:MAG: MFS transporter [Thermoplasmata archaeon]
MNRYMITGLITMMFSSIFQYSWNAFELTLPIVTGIDEYTLSIIFTLYIVFSSTSQIFSGYIADLFGPRRVFIGSLILAAAGLIFSSQAKNVDQFVSLWVMGSVGEGSLYGISVNMAIKWNDERRGFSAGFVSMGFGIGATFANPFIFIFKNFRLPMLILGILMLIVLLSISYTVKYPVSRTGKTPIQLVKEKKWWLVFVSYSFAGAPLQLFSFFLLFLSKGFGISYLILVAMVFPFISGVGRPFIGHFSDRIGRKKSIIVTIFFILIGVSFALIYSEISILAAAILISLFGGSLFTLYSSYVADIYGTKYSTSNNGILYSGKAMGGLIGVFIFSAIDIATNLRISLLFIIAVVLISLVSFILASVTEK